ncbi:uncharacterized protein LOC116289124 [Actinia tenebrosa]|uniref:Uncharacterized protein LOC116289124 n=1 Tax=Actinia tenebrosa TaxID=6105 RepID=A0A6P8HGZ1_ACTTE|nr:uncharacterized protein LOC116289124 [Actinia tenebrosa]
MQTSLNAVKMKDETVLFCPGNCNDRGACVAGSCVCEVRYSGGNCTDSNLGYNIGFGLTFYLLCVVCFLQLVLCIWSEFGKLKRPSLAKACRPTVQKMLYICMIIACGSRGVYHSIQEYLPGWLAPNLFSVYYPIIMSGFSIIICFWAETFHVEGLQLDKPRFLSKSNIGFIIFNAFIYLLLAVQVITIEVTDYNTKVYLHNIFSGIFASLMFLVLIFFLIYGVELYYKVRGAFMTTPSSRVDCAQVTMSRLGLVSQAFFQLLISMYLMGEVMGKVWKDRLPVDSRNVLEILFRILEVAVALWFPCCLWNWKSPHQLWILNPNKLLLRQQSGENQNLLSSEKQTTSYDAIETKKGSDQECWVCYDNERRDAGDMIYPCQCKGDVAAVHHECLRRWLLELSTENHEVPKCKVCGSEYIFKLSHGRVWLPSGLNVRYWLQAVLVLAVMVTSPIGAYILCISKAPTACKVLIIGICIIMEYLCLRLMGFNMMGAYRRARLTAITIIGRHDPSTPKNNLHPELEVVEDVMHQASTSTQA